MSVISRNRAEPLDFVSFQGFSPSPVPKSMNFAIVSYMMLRLEFPQMISSSGVTPSIGAKVP